MAGIFLFIICDFKAILDKVISAGHLIFAHRVKAYVSLTSNQP